MNLELSEIMKQEGRMIDWANTIQYNTASANNEDKEISAVLDDWARTLGKNCHDPNNEVATLIRRSITPDVVQPAGEVLDMMFDQSDIGEFDDVTEEIDAVNTIQVFDAVPGGNVDRSFIDTRYAEPKWTSLQAETDLTFQKLRRDGYREVARILTFIRDALEAKKVARVTETIAAMIAGGANYFTETTSMPTDASMEQFALYLHDMEMGGGAPIAFGLNKYIQAISKLSGTSDFATDKEKNMWNRTGFILQYSGVELLGYTGQRKLADGSTVVPDKMLIGVAGKIGSLITRGETRVLESNDINAERLHIKVTGYTFGTSITKPENVAKLVMLG